METNKHLEALILDFRIKLQKNLDHYLADLNYFDEVDEHIFIANLLSLYDEHFNLKKKTFGKSEND